MKNSKVDWAGEARGISDVVFTRLRAEERSYINSLTTDADIWTATMTQTLIREMELDDCVLALVYQCERNNRKLVDVLEEVLVSRREYYKRSSK